MNFKKAILVTLLISIFMISALSAVNATTKTTSTSKVTKATLKLTAPTVTNTYKKSQNFKLTVKNKKTGKAMPNVKATIKIDKKTYNKKTNNKGIISINTKSLSKGTHKVLIKIKATKKYKAASKRSTIKITSKNTVKEKIKTHFELDNVKYDYGMDGVLYRVYYYLSLHDENGNEIDEKFILKRDDSESYYEYSSSEAVMINDWTANNYNTFKVIFKGNDKYEPCSYTLPVDPSKYH